MKPPAHVIAGSAGWYVADTDLHGVVTLYGPILCVELAHEVAEECDAAWQRVREHVLADLRAWRSSPTPEYAFVPPGALA